MKPSSCEFSARNTDRNGLATNGTRYLWGKQTLQVVKKENGVKVAGNLYTVMSATKTLLYPVLE